jgi:nitrite reductase (NO-forming)
MSRARHHEASMARSLAAILVLGGVSVSAAQAKTVKVELTAKETSVPANNERTIPATRILTRSTFMRRAQMC